MTKPERVRVSVADDHPMFRDSLARAIDERPDLDLIGEAEDGLQALEQIRELVPDVAVLDVRMPELEGPQVLHAVKRDGLPTEVLFLSAHTDDEIAYGVVAGGARGFLSKRADRREILEAIGKISRGETILSPEIQSALASEIAQRETEVREGPLLTPRENEVLQLVAEGKTNAQIGERIYLSPATVKDHLGTLYEKLGVSDRAAAVAEAMRRGLLE